MALSAALAAFGREALEQALDARRELLGAPAAGVGIELAALERAREELEQAVARAGEALVERFQLVLRQAARLAPRRLRGLHAGDEVVGRLRRRGVRRGERLELRADPLARLAGGFARVRVAVLVAVEEAVAGGAEALPDGVGAALLDRADRAPLRLQLLDPGRGLLPVGGRGERLGLLAQRFLLREVLLPLAAALARGAPGSA